MDSSIVFARLGQCDGSAIFAQMTAERPILYNGPPLCPSKLSFPMGDLGPYLKHNSVDLPESSTKTASRSVKPFCRSH